MSEMSGTPIITPKRYHPALVALHWLIALLILLEFALVKLGEGGPLLNIHMIFGILILVLLIIRLVVRFAAKRPAWADTGNPFFNTVGEWTHWGLYLLTFAMTITGIILASSTNRLARLFGLATGRPTGQFPQPGQFPPPRGEFRGGGFGFFALGRLHGAVWALLTVLIVLHIGAALYHQFYLKDNLLKRMWFGD